ncbi:hypothetical protein Pyn_23409 [Prunus yedoensis var. nudiflora]|uniref:Uncharacterized protein n=1 Tax=Prunus yedoensis var. nudiflora TaxID=2094558 RepID=A0A314UC22_PRUYE|nr:hypothetical protein Pyn_23409 [Prunus yedoensis var. nudiflora]
MATEDHEMPHGWPLGLEIMNMRLRVVESLPAAVVGRRPLHIPSASFTSFSSSNLDTESTASFFQDHSMSLGRLIGFRTGDRGRLYYPNSICFEEHDRNSIKGSHSDVSTRHQADMSRRICIPLLLGAIVKISRSKSKSKSKKAVFDGKG